jgi:integrase
MITKRTNAAGESVYVIDLRFKNRHTHVEERYRREAKQTKKEDVTEEERSILSFFHVHGTIAPLLAAPKKAPAPAAGAKTWTDAVKHWREVKEPHLKASTRRGYGEMLESGAFDAWAGLTLPPSPAFVQAWDAQVATRGGGDSRRRNFHVVLRSILKCAAEAEWFDVAELARLPKLPKVGRTEVDAAHAEDVARILGETDEGVTSYVAKTRACARRALALAAYGGLRSSEIRSLRWRDVDLRKKTITIRTSMCEGVIADTKSGDERTLPIAPPLLLHLDTKPRPSPDAFVAGKANGAAWGDSGILQALRRACERLGLDRGKVHAFRHYFSTSRFAHGADAPTVQKLLGHKSLSTTQRYSHTNAARMRTAVESW